MNTATQNSLILETLRARRGAWVSMPELVEVSGSYNVHSRIDELRRRGARIPPAKVVSRDGGLGKASFYRIEV